MLICYASSSPPCAAWDSPGRDYSSASPLGFSVDCCSTFAQVVVVAAPAAPLAEAHVSARRFRACAGRPAYRVHRSHLTHLIFSARFVVVWSGVRIATSSSGYVYPLSHICDSHVFSTPALRRWLSSPFLPQRHPQRRTHS